MFDVYTTVVFPIVGGIIAGVIVILIELGFRVLYEWNQRKRGAKDISRFFGEWEAAINTSVDLPASPTPISPTQALHKCSSLYCIPMVKISFRSTN